MAETAPEQARLKATERDAQREVEAQEQVALDARQAAEDAQRRLADMQDAVREQFMSAQRAQELRVLLYRLALTLPLLAAAG